jgi:hypothetical protein
MGHFPIRHAGPAPASRFSWFQREGSGVLQLEAEVVMRANGR